MKEFQLSKRDRDGVAAMAAGKRDIDVCFLKGVLRRVDKILPDLVWTVEDHPLDNCCRRYLQDLKSTKQIAECLIDLGGCMKQAQTSWRKREFCPACL